MSCSVVSILEWAVLGEKGGGKKRHRTQTSAAGRAKIISWGLTWCKNMNRQTASIHNSTRGSEKMNQRHCITAAPTLWMSPQRGTSTKGPTVQRRKNNHTHTQRPARMWRNPTKQRMMVIMTHSYATHSGACARAEHIKLSKCNTCSVSVLLPCTGM